MKYLFAITFAILVLLSFAATLLAPQSTEEGKIPLVWASDDNPARREQIDLYNQINPEYHLNLDPIVISLEKVIVQCMAGVGPDLIDAWSGFHLSAYVNADIAWDITDEAEKLGIDVHNDVWQSIHSNMIYEGRVYGVGTNVAVDAIWFNKDLFDQQNIPYPEYPWTPEELIAIGQQLTVYNEDGRLEQVGFIFDINFQWLHFLRQFGGSVFNEQGTKCILDSPEAIEAVQFMYDLIYKYKIAPSPSAEASMVSQGGWGGGQVSLFAAGKVGMALGGRYWLCSFRNYDDLRLGVVESPMLKERCYRGYGKATIINKNSPRREEALSFLVYQMSEGYNNLINSQADGVGPVKKFTYTEKFLHNTDYPDEDYNAVWREVTEYGIPDEISPFVNGMVVERIIKKQLDLIRNNQKTPKDGMLDATKAINQKIQEAVENDPRLKKRYTVLESQER